MTPGFPKIADPQSEVYLSAARVKVGLGRLELPEDLDGFIAEQMRQNRFLPLAVTIPHTLKVRTLPEIHKDPFDRLLVAQAQVEGLVLVSGDRWLARYPVPVLW